MNRALKNLLIYFFIVAVAAYFIYGGVSSVTYEEVGFTYFIQQVENKNVESVTIFERDHIIKGSLKKGSPKHFQTTYPSDYDITAKLLESGVENIKVDPQNSLWLSILINIFPFVLIILFWIFMMNQMQGGNSKIFNFAKSKARLAKTDFPKVTFKDVAGLDEAIEELQEIKEYLKNPKKFLDMGARIPKGILLYGPPGSGKTLLARALAGEAKVPFFSISGSEFVEMFVGVGASRVRDLFEQAKQNAPCIIFIDEIDAVGRMRGAGLGGGHDEREQTLNQLLVEMDGFDVNDSIIVIAATNRPDILDPALLRPGRFDRHIVVDRPDLEGRKAILKVHTRGKPLAKDVDLEVLARRTPGFTGADLANMVNEAAILAARHRKKLIDMQEFEEAIDRVLAGPEKRSRIISDKEKEIIAYHEAGHALVAHILPNTNPVHKISIIPRGRALGYTLTLPTEDRYLVTKSELLDELAMMLAGRVAEEMVFGDVTTGASDDLERATKIARQMVTEYGMSENLGPLTFGHKTGEVFLGRDLAREPNYSPEVAYEIDKEVRQIIDTAYARAKKILEENKAGLDRLARTLIEKETITSDELYLILNEDSGQETETSEETVSSEKAKLDVLGKLAPELKGKLKPAEG
ncbi:MAG: ATP-dependent zinc metalloprotease FtsH [Actinobacteria bacterium]|nr:ATP-dependent zinc metalloprotease FtsH [Actinomycetota bacterium]